jgi:signal transduction histidine kinase
VGAWSAGRVALRRRTLRFHLTLLYCALFLVTGAGLLGITYVLVDSTGTTLLRKDHDGTVIAVNGETGAAAPRLHDGGPSAGLERLARQLNAQAAAQHARDLHELLTQSGLALAAMTALAIALAWLTVGRALHPLRAMKRATQRITEHNLDERLGLSGPGDEVKDLADTIDGLLARLETAFEAQRRFVASASHELRTPLTLNRALLEVALADPDAGAGDLRATCEELLAAGEHQERLVEALLTLATSERGLDRRDPFDLAVTTRRALAPHRAEAERRGLKLSAWFGHAAVLGDPDLTERMAANLIDNAIRYNLPGGRVEVRTETGTGTETRAGTETGTGTETRAGAGAGADDDHAVLTVANTGPPVPADQVDQLFQPFRRLTADRTSHPDGHGLGLSIVRAIATAHDARLEVRLGPGGGLTVAAHFPAIRRGR